MQVQAVLAAATTGDGVAPLSEAALIRLRGQPGAGDDPDGGTEPAMHLLAQLPPEADLQPQPGPVVGYAQVQAGAPGGGLTGELVVHPAKRGAGIGAALVRAVLAQAGPQGVRLWAHGEHPAADRLARRFGFTRARVLLRLRRGLREPLPVGPELAAGVRLRPFVPGQDEQAFIEVNNRAFAWHPEQGGWGLEQVRARQAEPWFDPAGFLLAVDEQDRLLGFHWTKIHTAAGVSGAVAAENSAADGLGEVYVLGVDPAQHGRGLGTVLTLAGLRYLRDRGLGTVMLYVEADNTAALRTYRGLGFSDWNADVAYQSP